MKNDRSSSEDLVESSSSPRAGRSSDKNAAGTMPPAPLNTNEVPASNRTGSTPSRQRIFGVDVAPEQKTRCGAKPPPLAEPSSDESSSGANSAASQDALSVAACGRDNFIRNGSLASEDESYNTASSQIKDAENSIAEQSEASLTGESNDSDSKTVHNQLNNTSSNPTTVSVEELRNDATYASVQVDIEFRKDKSRKEFSAIIHPCKDHTSTKTVEIVQESSKKNSITNEVMTGLPSDRIKKDLKFSQCEDESTIYAESCIYQKNDLAESEHTKQIEGDFSLSYSGDKTSSGILKLRNRYNTTLNSNADLW
eukprot:CAMPEP_0194347192 /NCGR_PEP_ID=MMETSP0171-20130528/105851_1 /TAXON_ID=218684 /ORGANISM="Corethron pennatum, Strain L29A3" /LENGTH=310 /DNA_ID=CAMNT_0039114413 /DNA_START=419 /DNA_END=1348 /DNA_ORIENTATION=+